MDREFHGQAEMHVVLAKHNKNSRLKESSWKNLFTLAIDIFYSRFFFKKKDIDGWNLKYSSSLKLSHGAN